MERCGACGEPFGCGMTDGAKACWCAELPNVMPLKAEGCLCPKCLRAAVEKAVGACFGCRHSKTSRTKGGSTVFRCLRAESDARYPRYPRLPLARCDGKELSSEHGR